MKYLVIKNKRVSLYHSHNIWSLCKLWILVFLAFNSMMPYLFWGKGVIICAVVLVLGFVQFMQYFYECKNELPAYSRSILLVILSWILFFTYRYIIRPTSLKDLFVSILVTFYPVMVLILCTDIEKKRFLDFFTSFIAFVLFISLLEYFGVIFGLINITPQKIYFPESTFYEYFDNYGLFIVVKDLRNFLIPRFQSIFVEPGHLGMMCALILYANKYNLRDKRGIIILISALVTMSLATYILLLIGVFLFIYSKSNRKVLIGIVLFICAIIGLIGTIVYYNRNPDSYFSKTIISRLMPDKDKGIKGNNRTTSEFKKYYAEQTSAISIESLFGYGANALDEKLNNSDGNASASVFIFQFGFIGLLLLLLFYLAMCIDNYSHVILGMLVLFSISFLQRPYATWFSQIALLMTAASGFREQYRFEHSKLTRFFIKCSQKVVSKCY